MINTVGSNVAILRAFETPLFQVPLGEFTNNTVHSQGWFGVWIFQQWNPVVGGACDSTEPEPAKLYGLTAWNCEKGE